jgi:tRNA threonylcarbamoyladenosine biosynthesis protein TsaB
MRLLALESSSERCSVCLVHDGRLICRTGDGARTHSELMLPFVHEVLGAAGCRLRDVDGIACGIGPGAFTGLRLACGVAQGLALAAGLPLIGVGSLEALALQQGDGAAYVCVDARMSEVYCAAYRVAAEEVEAVLAPVVVSPGEAPIPPAGDWRGCGSGFAAHATALARRLGAWVATADAVAMPEAAAVARLAAGRWRRGERPDPASVTPVYVRDKVALTVAERSRSEAA